MAKYSVNATEVVADDGLIDWARLKNKPANLVTGINTTSRLITLGTGDTLKVTHFFVENDGAGNVRGVVERTRSNCAACLCGDCLLPGMRILLADGSLKAIETFQGGEMVMSARGPSRITRAVQTVLGAGRSIHAVGPLFATDDHPLWVRHGVREYWGTANLAHWRWQRQVGLLGDAPDPIHLPRNVSVLVARRHGWMSLRPERRPEFGPDTVLHTLEVEAGSFFAEGFLVASYPAAGLVGNLNWRGQVEEAVAC